MSSASKPTHHEDFPISRMIADLLELQGIHQNLDRLEVDINALRTSTEKEERVYLAAKERFEKNLPFVEKTQREHGQLKTELDEIKARIAELEESKKKIKTIKEFKSINKDIDSLNKKNALRENDLLTKGEDLEYKQGKLADLQAHMEKTLTDINRKKEELDNLIHERKDEISKYKKEKEKVVSRLPEAVVATFDRIYRNKAQKAVVELEEKICQGCYMRVPPQVDINVRKGDQLVFCPSCSRILYRSEVSLAHTA